MFPLQSALLPGETLPLRIFEPRYSRLVLDCLDAAEPAFGVVLISRGREVGGGDVRSDVGALARITEYADHGEGQYQLLAVDRRADPGRRVAARRPLPPGRRSSPGPTSRARRSPPSGSARWSTRILALYQRVAEARGGQLRPDALAVDAEIADDPSLHIYALASRVPMGQADRYAVLAAPTLAERVDVLTDAIETVTAMVEFQLTDE